MNGIFKRKTSNKNYTDLLSPEKQKLLHDASLGTLNKLYEKCYEEGIPRGALIDALEKEIYLKTIKEENWKIDYVYWLKKFFPKKKKDHNEQQPRA